MFVCPGVAGPPVAVTPSVDAPVGLHDPESGDPEPGDVEAREDYMWNACVCSVALVAGDASASRYLFFALNSCQPAFPQVLVECSGRACALAFVVVGRL